MPWTCFNYPADVPPGTRNPNAVQPGLRGMPNTLCLSYPAHAPRSMPATYCFSYSADALLSEGVQPDLDEPRTMPAICFRY